MLVSAMAWIPLILLLLAHYPGSWAQSGLTQEKLISESVRKTVTMSCSGTYDNVGSNSAAWYQKIPGAAPKAVMFGSTRPSGIPTRFTGTWSGNKASLTISDIQPEDEADYYCSSWDDSINHGTVLQTQGEVRQKPSPALSADLYSNPCKH